MLRACLLFCALGFVTSNVTAAPIVLKPKQQDESGDWLPAWAKIRLGHPPMTQAGYVDDTAFSADGRFMAATGEQSPLVIWDLAYQRQVRSFKHNGQGFTSVDLSPDGRFVVAGSIGDATVRVWDVEAGRLDQVCYTAASDGFGSPSKAAFVRYLNQGSTILSFDTAGYFEVWDRLSGRRLRQSKAIEPVHPNQINEISMAVSSDELQVALSVGNGTIQIFNIATNGLLHTIDDVGPDLQDLAFSPNGKLLAWIVRSYGPNPDAKSGLVVRNLETGQVQHQIRSDERNSGGPAAITFQSDGTKLATCDQSVNLLDLGTGDQSVLAAAGATRHVSYTPDGNQLVLGGARLQFHDLIRPDRQREAPTIVHGPNVAFPDDMRLIAVGLGKPQEWNVRTGKLRETFPSPLEFSKRRGWFPLKLLLSRDGQWIAYLARGALDVASTDGQNCKQLTTIRDPDARERFPDGLNRRGAISSAGEYLATILCDADERKKNGSLLRLFDLATSELLWEHFYDDKIIDRHLMFSLDGSRLLVTNTHVSGDEFSGLDLTVLDTRTGKQLASVQERKYRGQPEFTPDNRQIVAGSIRGTLHFLDGETFQEEFILHPPGVLYRGLFSLSPDGQRIVTADTEAVSVLDVATGQLTHWFAQPVISCTFAADSDLLALCLPDQSALIVDLEEHQSDLGTLDEEVKLFGLQHFWLRLGFDQAVDFDEIEAHAFAVFGVAGNQSVDFLRHKLIEAPEEDRQQFDALVDRLAATDVNDRIEAIKQLERYGAGLPALLRSCHDQPFDQTQQSKTRKIFDRLSKSRLIVVMKLLYAIGTPDARLLFTELAKSSRATRSQLAETLELSTHWDRRRTQNSSP
jgi:WD40 repeat protein